MIFYIRNKPETKCVVRALYGPTCYRYISKPISAIPQLNQIAVQSTVIIWKSNLIRFSGDTCLALDEYQINPQNSSLGSILPCSDSANNMLEDVGTGIHNLINQVIATIEK